MRVIKVENLYKKFSSQFVIENLSFSVEKGEYLYVVGENGSGKTTLIKLLLGLEKQTSGKIEFENSYKGKIGYLPQQSKIQSDFPASVFEVVMSGFLNRAKLIPFYKKEQKEKAEQVLKKLNIFDIKNKSFRLLSGGQKQKVLLARGLCAADGILLLDEPLTALDPLATAEFYDILDELKKTGTTLIIISHDVQCAVKYADKILHLGRDSYFFGNPEDYKNSNLGKKMLVEGHRHD